MPRATRRSLVGRKIVGVDFKRQYDSSRHVNFTQPVLTLDNGCELVFVVQETDIGEYGVTILEREARDSEGMGDAL